MIPRPTSISLRVKGGTFSSMRQANSTDTRVQQAPAHRAEKAYLRGLREQRSYTYDSEPSSRPYSTNVALLLWMRVFEKVMRSAIWCAHPLRYSHHRQPYTWKRPRRASHEKKNCEKKKNCGVLCTQPKEGWYYHTSVDSLRPCSSARGVNKESK